MPSLDQPGVTTESCNGATEAHSPVNPLQGLRILIVEDNPYIAVALEALTRLGTPFIFTTGCGRAGLPEAFLDRPIVEKPFYIEEILQTLRGALTSAGGG